MVGRPAGNPRVHSRSRTVAREVRPYARKRCGHSLSARRLWRRSSRPLGAEGLGRAAGGAEGAQAQGVVAFGEALAGGVQDQRAMVEGGGRQHERLVEQELPERGNEEVGTTLDFGDAHVDENLQTLVPTYNTTGHLIPDDRLDVSELFN